MPCAGERRRPLCEMLHVLRTNVKKVGVLTLTDWKTRLGIREQTGQKEKNCLKARVTLARSMPAIHAL